MAWREGEADLIDLREQARREKECVLQDATLERYRALKAVRSRGEARELRLVEQMETLRPELDKRGHGDDGEVIVT